MRIMLMMMMKKPKNPYYKNNTLNQKEKSKKQHRKNENQIKTKHRKKNSITIHNTKKYISKDTTQIEKEYTFNNKKSLLKCGDIGNNPGPRPTLLLNHPQEHVEKQKTYFFHKTTQIKPEYNHIMDLFKSYLNHTHTSNINPHLTQFCRDNNHCPESYLFYAILTTLVPTPTQCNQLIEENFTQWTTNLIEHPHPLPTDQYKLTKFYSENKHITKPLESIQKELYSFITNEQPNMTTIQHKFPYLPEQMILEALKCLQPIPNFTHPEPIQNYPPINSQHTPYTNPTTKILSWNYGTLNTTLPRLQSLTNKPTPPSIIAI
jgi:hypothetical protein